LSKTCAAVKSQPLPCRKADGRLGPEGLIAQDYGELISAFVKRRKALGLTQADVDYRSGLQEGYTGKIESWQHPTSGRGLGALSLPLLMKALGVVLVVKPLPGVLRRQMSLGLEGQLDLPLVGGDVSKLPPDQTWLRVVPGQGKGRRAQKLLPASQKKPAQPQPRRKPSGSAAKSRARRAGPGASSLSP
jgi:hypothetical protein